MKTWLVLLASWWVVTSAPAQLSAPDAQFLDTALRTLLLEAQFGVLLVQQAESEELIEYGRQLWWDTREPLRELSELAREQGLPVPRLPAPLQLAALQIVSSYWGAEFDRQAILYAIQLHQQQLLALEQSLEYLDKPALRNFARLHQIPVTEHLRQARQLWAD